MQFNTGELEATIIDAFMVENPDGVVLQHAPKRKHRCDFPHMGMPTPASEINLIETFTKTKVIGVTINHENMKDAEVSSVIQRYEDELGIPTTDALSRSPKYLVEMVLGAFPKLPEILPVAA